MKLKMSPAHNKRIWHYIKPRCTIYSNGPIAPELRHTVAFPMAVWFMEENTS